MNLETKLYSTIGFCVILLVAGLSMVSCTPNTQTKVFGGTMTIKLPPGQKLVNVTWKDNNSLWYLTRPARADEPAETSTFKEDSSLGIIEGKVIFVESR